MMVPSLAMRAVLAASLGLGAAAQAATPEAWSAHDRAVIAACEKASGLDAVSAIGRPVVFSDTNGKTALLLVGRARPARLKGKPISMLCLYDRTRKVAEAQETPGLAMAPETR